MLRKGKSHRYPRLLSGASILWAQPSKHPLSKQCDVIFLFHQQIFLTIIFFYFDFINVGMEGWMLIAYLHKYYLFVLIFIIISTHDHDDDDDDKIGAIRISSDKYAFILRLMDIWPPVHCITSTHLLMIFRKLIYIFYLFIYHYLLFVFIIIITVVS